MQFCCKTAPLLVRLTHYVDLTMCYNYDQQGIVSGKLEAVLKAQTINEVDVAKPSSFSLSRTWNHARQHQGVVHECIYKCTHWANLTGGRKEVCDICSLQGRQRIQQCNIASGRVH